VHVPPHLQEIAAGLALESWVHSPAFAWETHLESVDLFKETLRRHASEDGEEPTPKTLATALAAAIDKEGRLLTYVLERGTVEIGDEERWLRICIAAGYVVLKEYEDACNCGKWPRDR
jgi:hypothetical protein